MWFFSKQQENYVMQTTNIGLDMDNTSMVTGKKAKYMIIDDGRLMW